MRTIDPEKYQQKRMEIIGAAVELFATKGFAKTTTAEICRAAGISSGSLFHYFRSKQAVFYALFELDQGDWQEVFASAADEGPWATLMKVVERSAEEAASPLMAGLLIEVLAQAHRDPHCAALVKESDDRMIEGLTDLVDQLRADGTADPGMDSATAARWIMTIIDGFHGRGYPEPDRDRDADVATTQIVIARTLRCTTDFG